jgi:hypothetical protein
MVRTLGVLVYGAMMLALGVLCLWRPEKVQMYAIKSTGRGSASWNLALRRFVESRRYLWNVRFVGAIAILMAVFLLAPFIFGGLEGG